VEITADAPGRINGTIDWKIVVPRTANLDLVTHGGSITMGDSDGFATLRTTGGSVTVGHIKGKAAIITQGGFIKAGDLGSSAELRSSSAGSIEVGNIAGDAILSTAGGPITAGIINGQLSASTAGGNISIKGAHGEVVVRSEAGDTYIGDAARVNARTAGNITNQRVRGSFKGITDSGDIRVENAGGWVEASSGFGSIFVRMMPENYDGDLHVNLQTGVGDITIYIPARLKATVETMVERPTLHAQNIYSDFPMNSMPVTPHAQQKGLASTVSPGVNRFSPPERGQFPLNGGGVTLIHLHASLGKIFVKKN
jgi:hypothetical protein